MVIYPSDKSTVKEDRASLALTPKVSKTKSLGQEKELMFPPERLNPSTRNQFGDDLATLDFSLCFIALGVHRRS